MLGDVTFSTLEHLPSPNKNLVLHSASDSNGCESLITVSCLNLSVVRSNTRHTLKTLTPLQTITTTKTTTTSNTTTKNKSSSPTKIGNSPYTFNIPGNNSSNNPDVYDMTFSHTDYDVFNADSESGQDDDDEGDHSNDGLIAHIGNL